MPRGQARARLHEPCIALGNRDREPGSDDGPLPRAELVALAGAEIEAGVAGVSALR